MASVEEIQSLNEEVNVDEKLNKLNKKVNINKIVEDVKTTKEIEKESKDPDNVLFCEECHKNKITDAVKNFCEIKN
jgi:hypothetical protein